MGTQMLLSSSPLALGLPDADITYHPAWLDHAEAASLLATLLATTPWSQRTLRVAGLTMPLPRLTAWVGDPGAVYAYSGIREVPLPWTPMLADLRHRCGTACGTPFNSVLLNYYRDGRDQVGWHADDELELGPAPVIASVSLGAPRVFALKPRGLASARPVRLSLLPGSLLVMRGTTQTHWLHSLPADRTCQAPRINLTFRWISPMEAPCPQTPRSRA